MKAQACEETREVVRQFQHMRCVLGSSEQDTGAEGQSRELRESTLRGQTDPGNLSRGSFSKIRPGAGVETDSPI